jgi:hypothetical protein
VAETDLYDGSKLDDAVALVVKAVEDCERRYHDAFVEKVERRYMSYRGLIDDGKGGTGGKDTPRLDEEDWHSNVTTPYVLQTCEGMLATMLEPSPSFNVRPRPKPDEPIDEVMQRILAIESIQDTLKYALDRASFAGCQRDFMQQDMIAGLSVLKDFWHRERRDVTRLVPVTLEIENAYGEIVDHMQDQEEQTDRDVLVIDDAAVEVVDVRDFFWPSQAPNVEKAEYLVHRTWETTAALKRMEKAGYLKNVDKLNDPASAARLSDITKREMRLRNLDRTQSLHEVLEYWTPERKITVGDRTVLLDDRKNPLWLGRRPFTVCSSMPDAFQIPGLSVVEALAQLQEMLWTLQNQRLDVVRMLANLITLIRSDVDDPEAFEWAPNAQWFVEDPGQVDTLKIDPTVANITLQAEAMLKGDLQNIMGGLPYASGADSSTIDQQTATGVSIITTIAQRIIQARKQHYLWAYAKLGKHFLLLYQQFLRDDRVVAVVGRQGADAYKTISPLEIQGDFDVTIDVTSDSLIRQERRAERSSLMQMAAGVAPIMAQSGAMLNLRAFMEGVLDAYDVDDKERYFMPGKVQGAVAAQTPPPGAEGGNGNGQVPGAPEPTTGVTNVPAAAGPSSPSNVATMSPEAAMQRFMAARGGAANAPA